MRGRDDPEHRADPPLAVSATVAAIRMATADLFERAPSPGNRAFEVGRVRDVRLEYYRPRGSDDQGPHADDEIYVVAGGSAELTVGPQTLPLETGDAAFVAAGAPHRFTRFSDDFAAWVIFVPADGDNGDVARS